MKAPIRESAHDGLSEIEQRTLSAAIAPTSPWKEGPRFELLMQQFGVAIRDARGWVNGDRFVIEGAANREALEEIREHATKTAAAFRRLPAGARERLFAIFDAEGAVGVGAPANALRELGPTYLDHLSECAAELLPFVTARRSPRVDQMSHFLTRQLIVAYIKVTTSTVSESESTEFAGLLKAALGGPDPVLARPQTGITGRDEGRTDRSLAGIDPEVEEVRVSQALPLSVED